MYFRAVSFCFLSFKKKLVNKALTNTCDKTKVHHVVSFFFIVQCFVCFVMWERVGGIGMYVVPLRRFRVIITIIISNRVVLLE